MWIQVFVKSGVALQAYPTRRCVVRKRTARRILLASLIPPRQVRPFSPAEPTGGHPGYLNGSFPHLLKTYRKSIKNWANIHEKVSLGPPWAPQGTHKRKSMFWGNLFCDFRLLLGSLWGPISSPFRHRFSSCFCTSFQEVLKSIFYRFWLHFERYFGDILWTFWR